MTPALLFWILMLSCCGYAARFGGWEGRWFAFLYIGQSVLIVLAGLIDNRWTQTNWPKFAVDMMLLFGLWSIAARTHRFWPLWVFGLHLITISAHLASVVERSFALELYFLLATMWAIPKLLIVVIGIGLDRRAGLPDTRFASRGTAAHERPT